MTPDTLLAQLLGSDELARQISLLQRYAPALPAQEQSTLANFLKDEADQLLRSDARHSQQIAHLLYHLATITHDQNHHILGLFAEANALSIGGLGDHARAVELCDEAAAIYRSRNQPVDEAETQVTKIYALAVLGRYDEALAAGKEAIQILQENQAWFPLADIMMNLAIVYGRMDRDADALGHFDRAGELYANAGEAGQWALPGVEMNRALVLRNLGRFDESLIANRHAVDLLTEMGQEAEVGHAQQVMAFTLYILGHYNQALLLLYEAEELFDRFERWDDVLVTQLYLCDCLLSLCRFGEMIRQCEVVRSHSSAVGRSFEKGRATLIMATCYLQLGQPKRALLLFQEANQLFASNNHTVWAAQVMVESATLLLSQGQAGEALFQVEGAVTIFADRSLPAHLAYAQLALAEVYLHQQKLAEAQSCIIDALTLGETHDIVDLTYCANHLLGQLAEQNGDEKTALARYSQAVDDLERLQSRVMVEFRSSFAADKERIYDDLSRLYLRRGATKEALVTVERSRSSALRQLFRNRTEIPIQPLDDADSPLLAQLTELRQRRSQLVRQQEVTKLGVGQLAADPSADQMLHKVETDIEALWHRLLVRNAGYTSEAALWQVGILPALPEPNPETLLLSYAFIRDELHLFTITHTLIDSLPLAASRQDLARLHELLRRNLRMVPNSAPEQLGRLESHVQQILLQLYKLLLAPVELLLAQYPQLVIVPHGLLHYLPFHAFVREIEQGAGSTEYLIDTHQVSYLPATSLFSNSPKDEGQQVTESASGCVTSTTSTVPTVALGYDYKELLPQSVEEAKRVAKIMDGQWYVGDQVTVDQLQQAARQAAVLHIATHGEFRADNPLFSGLALHDDWVTTLDIFALDLDASLVTLSACQTGRTVIGGGDELLGLTRAFFAAGAASLLLTQWSVEDRSTALLMQEFYCQLRSGQSKAAALRVAQRHLRSVGTEGNLLYTHPYFWAPFFLEGESGTL